MATYLWSSLVDNQEIAFNPAQDTLVFPAGVTYAELTTWGSSYNPDPTQPYNFTQILINGQPALLFEYAGKTVYLVGITETNITSTNISLSNGSAMLFGDGLATNTGDTSAPLSIVGGSGAEYLQGYNFNDTLVGGAGDDMLVGGGGSDIVDGGGGFDTAAWNRGSTMGVYANLITGKASQGTDVDTLIGIEGLRGTNRNDVLIGNQFDNYFKALMGYDHIDGGAGIDVVRYGDWQALNGVNVDLSLGTASNDGFGTSDTLVNVENVSGTDFNDLIRGDANANRLEGRLGNDTLEGGSGADMLMGEGGNDSLVGGDGGDVLNGGAGNDTLVGGNSLPILDIDRVDYSAATAGLTLNLTTGTATAGGLGTDTLSGIEWVTATSYADNLTGDASDNYFTGRGGNDTINGGAGFDFVDVLDATGSVTANLGTGTLSGSGVGSDVLTSIECVYASNFADTLLGGAADELFRGNGGNDSINGGSGLDTADYRGAVSGVTVNLALGSATGGDGTDILVSIESAYGSMFGDILIGSAGDNTLRGRLGDDTMDGGAGRDRVDYRSASGGVLVDLDAGIANGADGFDFLSNIEDARGSYFDDDIAGDELGNTLQGLAGGDRLSGAGGNDVLIGDEGRDLLVGGLGNDSLTGGADDDGLVGGAGNDTLNGGSGADVMRGDDGSDSYYVDSAGDVVTESNAVAATGGTDIVYSSLSAYTLATNVENGRIMSTGTASLTGNTLNNLLYAGVGSNTINGGGGIDTVTYSSGVTTGVGVTVSLALATAQATGGSGSDTLVSIENLTGSAYADTLTGSSGNNVITGGSGKDTLRGNGGNDTFDFNALTDTGTTSAAWDVIADFNLGDRIDLSTLDANTTNAAGTNDAFSGTLVSSFTAAGQLRFDSVGKVLYGNTDGDVDAEFAIALTGVTALTASDFVL